MAEKYRIVGPRRIMEQKEGALELPDYINVEALILGEHIVPVPDPPKPKTTGPTKPKAK